MDQQALLKQATQRLRECADENERLEAENTRLLGAARREHERLVAENTRLLEAARRSAGLAARADAVRVIPVVVWPEPAFPLTFERLRSWAWYLGQELRQFVQPPEGLLALTLTQRAAIAVALCNGWHGVQIPEV